MLQQGYGVDQQRLLPLSVEDRLSTWIARCSGAALFLAGLAGWVSLISWSVSDPSLTHTIAFGPTNNFLGPGGAIVGDLMLQLLGLASTFLVLAPAIWGIELFASGRVTFARTRTMLLTVAVLALAAGCSALPTAANWPLHNGFGGVIGDLLYNLFAGLIAALVPVRAGAIAGLILFSGGLAAFICCLGLGGWWPSEFWQPGTVVPRPTLRTTQRRWHFQMPTLFRRSSSRQSREPVEPVLFVRSKKRISDPGWSDDDTGRIGARALLGLADLRTLQVRAAPTPTRTRSIQISMQTKKAAELRSASRRQMHSQRRREPRERRAPV